MYSDRIPLYKKLEDQRSARLLVYVTGDRAGMETQIHPEILNLLSDHLDTIGRADRVSLYLYTRGGHTLAAWSIANLIRQFCDKFEVIVASKGHSAGTLVCLGADSIVMTKQATLGPIDPSVSTPLNPEVPGMPSARFPVSVEAINGFIELARDKGISESSDMASILITLANHVHPIVLGQAYRTRTQIRMLGQRLLEKHMDGGEDAIRKILDFLCSESGSHDYTIYRREATDLGLPVVKPTEAEYQTIKAIYDDLAQELQLAAPFNPEAMLGTADETTYSLTRAVLESTSGGSDFFQTQGRLSRSVQVPGPGLPPQPTISDTRIMEGWRHAASA